MTEFSAQEITALLKEWSGGDRKALDKIIPLVYDELHRLAHSYLRRERIGHTLQTTALVNEAYLRLINSREIKWRDRAHFLAISANIMRRILVDFARSKKYKKNSGNLQRVSLDNDAGIPIDMNLVKLNDALIALSKFDPRKASVVELRFFGGLSISETAEVMDISQGTVKRDWRMAKVWLVCELKGYK
jgi:RNA polymerase sigma factor (TIGR02999 family)